MCTTVENPVLVHQETGNSQGTSHPRLAERDSRQAIQTWPDHSNRMVPSPRGFPSYICHQIQQQTTTVCVTGSRPPGMDSGCTQSVMGKSGPICLPTCSHLGQSGGEVEGLPMQQDHSDCTSVAQHVLVLGYSGNVQSDPLVSAQPAQSGVSTIQFQTLCRNLSNLHAWLVEPQQSRCRDSLRQWQDKLRLLIRWTSGHHFLLNLFQDKKLQPGSIDGYRSAIADKLGTLPLMSAKMRISPISWIVSIETGPSAGGVYPPGTCSWSCTS